jgi:hypothetical protein
MPPPALADTQGAAAQAAARPGQEELARQPLFAGLQEKFLDLRHGKACQRGQFPRGCP